MTCEQCKAEGRTAKVTDERLAYIRTCIKNDHPNFEWYVFTRELLAEVDRLRLIQNEPCYCCIEGGCQGGCRCCEKADPKVYADAHAEEPEVKR